MSNLLVIDPLPGGSLTPRHCTCGHTGDRHAVTEAGRPCLLYSCRCVDFVPVVRPLRVALVAFYGPPTPASAPPEPPVPMRGQLALWGDDGGPRHLRRRRRPRGHLRSLVASALLLALVLVGGGR